MTREIDRDNLNYEDALYLSQRGQLSAEEEAKFGIRPTPTGGAPSGLGPNTGDVGTALDTAIVGPGAAPDPEDVAQATAEAIEGNSGGGYSSWRKEELQAEANNRGLTTSGNKGDLIRRLEADDAEAADDDEG